MSKKILVVDDDRFYSMYLNTLIKKNFPEYLLLMAKDGEEAWDIITQYQWSAKYDMVIIDLEMPRLNGYGLMRRMNKELTELPKLVINSNYKFRTKEIGRHENAITVSTKPLNSSKVRDVLFNELGHA